MTMRMLKSYGGFYEGQVVTLSGPEETRLIGLGYAAAYLGEGDIVAASRALIIGDIEDVIPCNSASPIVLTIPADNVLGAANQAVVALYQSGAGDASFAAGAGVTLRGTAPTPAQYKTHGVMRVGANEWAYL